MFNPGLAFGGSFPSPYGTFGTFGTVTGVLTKHVLDTNAYTIDGDAAGSTALNAAVQKLTATADANRLRRDGLLKWERDGIKPTGDNVITPATVAAASYGCKHTHHTTGPDERGATLALRPAVLANSAACPAS